MKDRDVLTQTKIDIYKATINTIMTYGYRMLYQTLEHSNGNGVKYLNMDTKNAGTIIKARLELLDLGYLPYIRNDEHCRRCQSKVREDTLHYLGKLID